MKKQTKATIGTLSAFVFLFIGGVALFWGFESPELGSQALAAAGESSGVHLEAARFRLRLGQGLIGEDVEASSGFPGGRYRIRMERIVLEHRLLPLLAGKLLIRRVLLDRPRFDISLAGPGSTPPPSPPAERNESKRVVRQAVSRRGGGQDVALLVSEMDLDDGVVSVEGPRVGRLALFIGGLRIELRNPNLRPGALTLLHALTATGTLRARSVVLETMRVRDVSATLQIERGRLDLGDLVFSTDRGAFVGEVRMDFNRIPVGYEMHLVGGPLGSRAPAGSGGADGPGYVHVELEAQGFGTSSRNVKGKGLLKLTPGSLPPHPVLTAIEKALPSTNGLGSTYRETEARFIIQDNQLVFEPFHLETETAALEVSGTVHLEGALDLSLTVSVARRPPAIPEGSPSRRRFDGGGNRVRFHVTGTTGEPYIERVQEP